MLAMGVFCTWLSLWARRGRSELARWWPGSQPNEAAILCVMPALGLTGFSAAALLAIDDDRSALAHVVGLPAAPALLWAVYGIFGFPIPRRYFPEWAWDPSYARARSRRRERKRLEKRRRAAREKRDG